MTQPRPAALALSLSLAAFFSSLSCSSSNAGPAANPPDAGHDQAQVQDTSSGLCPARPDLPAGTPTCTTLFNSATAIPFTAGTGSAPAPAGGTIRDGLYESTRTEAFGGATGNGRRITFMITENATRMFWAGEVLDPAGATVITEFRADTAISVSGTRVNFTLNCMSSATSPIPAALDFTVSGQDLVLINGSARTTYTRRGCVP